MSKKKTKVINASARATFWNITDKVVTFAPLGVLVGINWNNYFGINTKIAFSNAIGVVLLCIFVAVLIGKKGKVFKGAGGFVMVFAICFFLRAILNDLVLISGCAAGGQVISSFITKPLQVKYEKLEDKIETAKINAQVLEKETEVSGRV